MVVKTKGIVLSETNYGETSKILNILTNDYGLIGVISKGCRNIKSKIRGVSQKMSLAEFTISYKEKGLSTLTEGSIINPLMNIYKDITKANYSFYLIDIVYQVLGENNNKELFSLLSNALIKINEGLEPMLISNILEYKLLKYLGVSLNIYECSLCGSNNLYTLDINNGGVICKNCYHDGYVTNNKTIKLLQVFDKIELDKITNLEITEPKIIEEINHFLREYYSVYTGIYLKDKSKFKLY